MWEAHSERLARTDTVHRLFARTNYFYNSFVSSSIAPWNALEDVQVSTMPIKSFKHLLHSCQYKCILSLLCTTLCFILYCFIWVHTQLALAIVYPLLCIAESFIKKNKLPSYIIVHNQALHKHYTTFI